MPVATNTRHPFEKLDIATRPKTPINNQRQNSPGPQELKDQLKSARASEDNLDEGYADGGSNGSAVSLPVIPTSLPSPPALSPALLGAISDVLARSKNFWEPVQLGLDELHSRLRPGDANNPRSVA